MRTIYSILLAGLLSVPLAGCGQKGALLLPSGQTPTPGQATKIGQPSDEDNDREKEAKPDGD